MKQVMPLRRAVVEVTHEAAPNDFEENRKAIRGWHNRLNNGSIPRDLVFKLGRQLFLDLEAWENWIREKNTPKCHEGPGRPRTK